MITSEFKNCFKLHRLLFLYLPEFLVKWDTDYETIEVNQSYFAWGIWILFMLDAVLIASGNFYLVYTHYFIQRRPHFNLTHAFIFITGGIAVSIVCIIAILLIWRRKELINGFNQMQKLHMQMTKRYRPKAFNNKGEFTNEGKQDMLGCVATVCIFCLGTSPYWIVLFVFFQHFDCIGPILDDILPDAKYRDFRTILLVNLARFVLVSPSIIEMIRSLSFFLPLGMTYLSSGYNSLNYLLHKMRSIEEFIWNYLFYQMAYKCIEFVLGDLLFVIITVDYFGTLSALGFCIVGFGMIENLMYISLACGTFLAILITGFIFVKLTIGNIMMEEMMNSKMIYAKLSYARIKTREAKRLKYRMESLKIIRAPFGSFFYLEREFGLEYFCNLTEHVVDAVLMFDLR